ncbi:MAG TPA: preprotein translocase subunit SecA [Bryobacteraceae bacterium]|nr:preprotein translocase subunit SecA [Bryobacteraceae bacterium]HOQ46853.1 preprotein translocase subunit SecA [Bryobacteraceae bacterium]HPU72978.1 preprotein translocase subunit SecA [Bryobacteraceae bacterium]
MLDTILAKIFGTRNERQIKAMLPLVAAINDLEPQMRQLSDQELAAKTAQFKEKLAQGATLDELLVEAFAVVREASRRVLNMRHFDVQLIGGIVLHRGKIAEMKTGEGKTLVATLPVYLNALEGKGVHVVTVNDYLAKRDAEWMGKIYKFLGLSVGVIVHELDDRERQQAYNADVTYGTNNEFGFDYLRDNMKYRLEDCVQRGHNYAIVDEVDSILIDEARTPLIISGPSEESTDKYFKVNRIIPKLVRGEVIEGKEPGEKYFTGDYTVDEKARTVALTDEGFEKAARLLGLPTLWDLETIEWKHHVEQALKAHVLFQRDRDYLVKDGEVIIVDEFTGRLMPGRRWSDGLHQAVEAKEGVPIQRENQTLATITFQNYFRMYKKLAGMTGTAETEAAEFDKIYKLDVVVIPTNRPLVRKEYPDVVYRTEEEKFRNAAKEIKACQERGQPVLVGTISVEKSEKLSGILRRMGVKHEVLNAKNHEREAYIVAQAGRKGAVTVSTNMAGRGTDILLGGNPEYQTKEYFRKQNRDPDTVPREEWDAVFQRYKEETDLEHEEVVALGGLHIVGTERHESRRIDNQLRGRAGRQGDPGSSRFYLSLQDDLLRIFGGERIQNLMLRLGMEEDVPIESRLITKRIEAAQKAVEAQNFAARKHLLEYDDVMNKQREFIYRWRRQLLEKQDQREWVFETSRSILQFFIDSRMPEKSHPSTWDLAGLQTDVNSQFGVKINTAELASMNRQEIEDAIFEQIENKYREKEELIGPEAMRETERLIMLHVIDTQWKDHLLSMDHLKEGIGLRGYGQKDPLVEYKKESFMLFEALRDRIEDEVIRYLFFLRPAEADRLPLPLADQEPSEDTEAEQELVAAAAQRAAAQATIEDFTRNIQRKKDKEMAELQFVGGERSATTAKTVVKTTKVGRNEPCPCGSGKKYKKCCGVNA